MWSSGTPWKSCTQVYFRSTRTRGLTITFILIFHLKPYFSINPEPTSQSDTKGITTHTVVPEIILSSPISIPAPLSTFILPSLDLEVFAITSILSSLSGASLRPQR